MTERARQTNFAIEAHLLHGGTPCLLHSIEEGVQRDVTTHDLAAHIQNTWRNYYIHPGVKGYNFKGNPID
jgi:hypothetical protein